MGRSRIVLNYESPRQEDILNLKNWIENTSCLAEEETAYLSQHKDLMTLNSASDDALASLVPLVEGLLRRVYRLLRKVCG